MAVKTQIVVKAKNTSKKEAIKPTKRNPNAPRFVVSDSTGAGGGRSIKITHANVKGEPIPATRFLRLLGYTGYSSKMAYALLQDAGCQNFNPHTMGCQLGSGRAQAKGLTGDTLHHGSVKEEDAIAFGKLVEDAKEYYLKLCGDRGVLETPAPKKAKKAKK